MLGLLYLAKQLSVSTFAKHGIVITICQLIVKRKKSYFKTIEHVQADKFMHIDCVLSWYLLEF